MNGQHVKREDEKTPGAAEACASESANSEMWARKYRFYVDTLKLAPDQASQWADEAVKSRTEALAEFENIKTLQRIA